MSCFRCVLLLVILGGSTVAQRKEACDPQAAARGLRLWREMKAALLRDDGPAYWEQIRGAMVPSLSMIFVGTVVSSTPADHGTTVILRMEETASPETTLRIKTSRSIPAGTKIGFKGVLAAFQSDPFMLTLELNPSEAFICASSTQ
jgi:hypothetical protein